MFVGGKEGVVKRSCDCEVVRRQSLLSLSLRMTDGEGA